VLAAVLSNPAHLLAQYYTELVNPSDPGNMVQELPLLILLVLVNIYILFAIPAATMSIFSGSPAAMAAEWAHATAVSMN
jgi:hypothetical protein